MLAVLSPTKTLDLTPLVGPGAKVVASSQPALLEQAHRVVSELKKLSFAKLKALLGVSDRLATLNHDRYKSFHSQPKKQAAYAFSGPAFKCLDAANQFTSREDVAFAQKHVRILSGVYGVLRPCDLIQPYRLDMGKKLRIGGGVGMYQFWGTQLSEQLNKELSGAVKQEEEQGDEKEEESTTVKRERKGVVKKAKTKTSKKKQGGDELEQFVLNCASQEYAKSIDRKALGVPVVDVRFQEPSGKSVAIYAKRARGMMIRHLVKERVHSLDGVKQFKGFPDLEQYKFSPKHSTDLMLIFVRVVGKSQKKTKKATTTTNPAKRKRASRSARK